MTLREQIEEQNAAIRAISHGLKALIDELHEAGLVRRENVASRLSRLRGENAEPIPTIVALASAISAGHFATRDLRDDMSVIDGGKMD